ncbi:MAG: hypothetical protein A3G29_00095 [Burkholderiales bacterium RIFCSPLOWO2_12_FULL_64_99]|jgi:uncharacterized membrane protein|nr:MAG: hypothetical protein A3E52_05390 [Burkholderiales bacterium RIFCSPHIGHO2_12_FULL_63_20]OGB66005.1 MAG: hypothetical protein A3G29_00095 [Burkholderiales bacterium RIFCSPLOWO2_12_FULL_64_99]
MLPRLQHLITVLPWQDWAALALFVFGWIGYALFASRRARVERTLLSSTNHYRRLWMLQVTHRDQRIVDAAITQNLASSPSFWASTTILVIGGLLAVLGTTEKASEFVRDLPFAVRTSLLVLDIKLIVLLSVFVYAFFRFTWSMRVYSFGAILVGAAPNVDVFNDGGADRQEFGDRAGKLMGMAAESFADGLRAYYMSFAVIAWLVSPVFFALGTLAVLWILYRREFRSDVLAILRP